MRRFLLIIYIFPTLSFSQSFLNVDGWTVYNNDPDFDLTKLKKIGVKDRKKIIEYIKEKPMKLFSFEHCNSLINKFLPQATGLELEEKKFLCYRSINFKKATFIALYRSELSEKELITFRDKMNETYSK